MPWSLADHPADVLSVFSSFEPGFRLVDGGDLQTLSYLLFSATNGAEGGTNEATAFLINNYITDVEGGTTFVLPPAIQGRYVRIVNNTANSIQVFGMSPNPQTGGVDTIAPATSTVQGVVATQVTGEACEYWCFAPGLWKQSSGAGAASGPGGGIPEAPLTGLTYGRQSATWVTVVPTTGGALTGALVLAAPTGTPVANQAVTWSQLQSLAIDEGTY